MNTHEWYVDKDGNLYCKAITDCILSGALFPVHGHFKTGPEAASMMEAEAGCIPYKLNETSKVLLRGKQNAQLPATLADFSEMPASLADILTAITAAGLPNVSMHLHKIENEQGSWKVTSIEHACLKPVIIEPSGNEDEKFPPSEIGPAKLSGYIDLSKLTKVEAISVLEYDVQSNKVKGMLPQICTKETYQVKKDSVVKM